jgi:hypothetical protein
MNQFKDQLNPFSLLADSESLDDDNSEFTDNKKYILKTDSNNIFIPITKPTQVPTQDKILSKPVAPIKKTYADKVKIIETVPTNSSSDDKANSNHINNNDINKSNNDKKILCINIIKNEKCNYGNKCDYAHSIKEQKLEPVRQLAYELIKGEKEFDNSIYKNDELMKHLYVLANICQHCIKKTCPGGYNCKYGVCDIKYRICYNNLAKGHCNDEHCSKVHLIKNTKPVLKLNNRFPKSREDREKINSDKKNDIIIPAVLLDEKFFVNKKQSDDLSEHSEDSQDANMNIINYLNTHSDDDYEESIFSKEKSHAVI